MAIASDESCGAVPKQRRNGPLGLPTHGESRGERVPEGMPAHVVHVKGDHRGPEDPGIEVSLIERGGEGVRRIDKRTGSVPIHLLNLPRAENVLRFFIQPYILHLAGFRLRQGDQAAIEIHVRPS